MSKRCRECGKGNYGAGVVRNMPRGWRKKAPDSSPTTLTIVTEGTTDAAQPADYWVECEPSSGGRLYWTGETWSPRKKNRALFTREAAAQVRDSVNPSALPLGRKAT